MPESVIIIALDGPAAAGKSSVGLAVARALGLVLVETGKLYRALGLKALITHMYFDDAVSIASLVDETDVQYINRGDEPRVMLDGEDVTDKLGAPEVANAASAISALPDVRRALLPIQRKLAKPPGVVMEGRDIGTVVFPKAKYKFYLDASLPARARRRQKDLVAIGKTMGLREVEADLELRDRRDVSRDISPLRRADDSIFVDTTNMPFDDVVNFIVNRVRAGEGNAAGDA